MDIAISNYLFIFLNYNAKVYSHLNKNYRDFNNIIQVHNDKDIQKIKIKIILLEHRNDKEIKTSDVNISCRFVNDKNFNLEKTYYHASFMDKVIANVEFDRLTATCEMKFDFWNECVFDLCFSMLFKIISQNKSIVLLHSSAIEIDNRAVLFCGKSGAGKSTIISNYDNYKILTDEISTLQTINDASWFVPIPWRSVTNKTLELGCICIIKQSNKINIRKFQDEAALVLSKFIYFNIWEGNKKINSINTIQFATEKYNIYELEIPICFEVKDLNILLRRMIYGEI